MKTTTRILWSWILIFALFDVLDLMSTAIGLTFSGVYETNLIAVYFFTFGNIGYLFCMMWSFSLIYLSMSFVTLLLFLYEKMTYDKPPMWLCWSLYSVIGVTFIIGKIQAILANIQVILFNIL